jgi:hypothetical protein
MPRKSKKKELKKIDSRKNVSRKTAATKPAVAKAGSGRKTSALIQNDQVITSQMQFSASTRFGAAMSCVPRARGASSPIAGFPTNPCPLPTRIQPRDDCEPAAGAGKNVDRDAVEEYLRAVNLPKAIAGDPRRSRKVQCPAQALSDQPGGLPRCHVGPRDGSPGQGRSRSHTRAAWMPRRQAARAFQAGEEARARCRIARPGWRILGTRAKLLEAVDAGAGSAWPHGFGARAERGGDRAFDNLSAKNLLPHLPRNWRGCREPTSTFCPSRTPGSPAR